jgi:hypothetical protein
MTQDLYSYIGVAALFALSAFFFTYNPSYSLAASSCSAGYTLQTDGSCLCSDFTSSLCSGDNITVTATKHTGTSFAGIVSKIVSLVNSTIIPLLYALAFLFFIFGVARYFIFEQGEEAQEKGKKFLLYGMIGLVVLFSVWGLVNLLISTLTSVTGVSTS